METWLKHRFDLKPSHYVCASTLKYVASAPAGLHEGSFD